MICYVLYTVGVTEVGASQARAYSHSYFSFIYPMPYVVRIFRKEMNWQLSRAQGLP